MKRKWLTAALMAALAVFDVGYLFGAKPDPDAPALAVVSLGQAVETRLPGGDVLVSRNEGATAVSNLEAPAIARQGAQGTVELTVLEYGAPAKGTPVRFSCQAGGFTMPIGRMTVDKDGRLKQALPAGTYRIDVLYGRETRTHLCTVSPGQRTALLMQRN